MQAAPRWIALLIAGALSVGACAGPNEQTEIASPTPQATTPEPTPSPEEPDPGTLHAVVLALPDSQTDPTTAALVRVPDGEPQPQVAATSFTEFVASPDAKLLARFERTDEISRLSVTDGRSFPTFREVVRTSDWISSVAWAPDGASLYLFAITLPDGHRERDPLPDERWPERLRRVPAGGGKMETIARFEAEPSEHTYRTLHGIDATRGVAVWTRETREGAGAHRDLSETDLSTGESTALAFRGIEGRISPWRFEVTANATRAFYATEGGRLRELVLATGEQRTLFHGEGPEQRYLMDIVSTTDGGTIAFRAAAKDRYSDDAGATTYTLRPSDLHTRVIARDESGREARAPLELSPEGGHLALWGGGGKHNPSPGFLDTTTARFHALRDDLMVQAWLFVPA